MVHVQKQHVVCAIEPEQRCAQEWAVCWIERLASRFGDQSIALGCARREWKFSKIDHRKRNREGRNNDLDEVPAAQREGRSQDLVPSDELVQAARQRLLV